MPEEITLRSVKGSALTNEEGDANILALLSKINALEVMVQASGIAIQSATPTVEQRGGIWFRVSGDYPTGLPMKWSASLSRWVAEHPVPPGSPERRLWTGSSVDLQTHDGGDNLAAGDASGPMWEIDTAASAKFLIGVGTLPSGATIAVGGTGGFETVTLAPANMAHKHPFGWTQNVGTTDEVYYLRREGAAITVPSYTGIYTDPSTDGPGALLSGITSADLITGEAVANGTATPHSNMPPYIGMYVIRRTSRKLFAV